MFLVLIHSCGRFTKLLVKKNGITQFLPFRDRNVVKKLNFDLLPFWFTKLRKFKKLGYVLKKPCA